MSIYFDPNALCFYDTSVFPAASIPNGCTSVTDADYKNLMDGQNGGGSIRNQNGSPVPAFISQSAATEMLHAGVIASTSVLGHVKIDASSPVGIDGNGCLVINNLGITTAMIAAEAVTTAKIADSAVTTNKINDKAVTTAKIDDKAVTTAKIDDDAVTTAKIALRGVTTAKINDGAVTTAKIADGAVTVGKLDRHLDVLEPDYISDPSPLYLTQNSQTATMAKFACLQGHVYDFSLYVRLGGSGSSSNYNINFVLKQGDSQPGSTILQKDFRRYKLGDGVEFRFVITAQMDTNIFVIADETDFTDIPTSLELSSIQFRGIKY